MPTITLRLDERTKNDLEAIARGRNMTLSELIRTHLDTLLVREGDPEDEVAKRGDVTPRSLTAVERQQLALLHRILARLVADDNGPDGDKAYQLERAEVLENGFVNEYDTEFAGIYPELSAKESMFVLDVLDLFRIATYSIDRLEKDGAEVDSDLIRSLRFSGFDANDTREAHMLSYARYLIDDGRWTELQAFFDKDGGNSHMPRAAVYERMLEEHRRIKSDKRRAPTRRDSYLLSLEELHRLAEAQIHPSNRT